MQAKKSAQEPTLCVSHEMSSHPPVKLKSFSLLIVDGVCFRKDPGAKTGRYTPGQTARNPGLRNPTVGHKLGTTTAALSLWIVAWRAPQAPGGMASIPTGEFWMGRTHYFLIDEVGWLERDRRDDTPAHKIHVDAFSMDK